MKRAVTPYPAGGDGNLGLSMGHAHISSPSYIHTLDDFLCAFSSSGRRGHGDTKARDVCRDFRDGAKAGVESRLNFDSVLRIASSIASSLIRCLLLWHFD